MPELPEVETVRRRLLTCLPGLLLREVVVNDPTVSEQSEAELNALLAGRGITGLRRRGKYLLVDLGSVEARACMMARPAGETAAQAPHSPDRGHASPAVAVIPAHDRGALVFAGADERPARFIWRLDPATDLHFQDVRRFGRLGLRAGGRGQLRLARHGAGALRAEFTLAYPRGALKDRRAPLKAFLLDQRRIAGVGNIYADEALFQAWLHPLRAAGSLGPREARRLHAALLETLQAGIDHEGSSIESFIDPAGERGSFQEILSVYQRTGKPCRVCGTIVERIVVGGRGTHYCPRCQPRRGSMAPEDPVGASARPRRRRGSAKPADWEAPGR